MAFEPTSPIAKTPGRVEVLTVTLQYSYESVTPEPTELEPNPIPVENLVKSAKFRIEVSDAAGDRHEEWTRVGNLIPHLTDEQKAWLTTDFMDVLWDKAAQIIPT